MPSQLFPLNAFEPTDEEICTVTGLDIDMNEDDDDDTLGGFIVADDEDDDAFANSVKKRKPKQPNRAIVQDSDDEQSEAEEEPAPSKKDKGKGKKEKTALELDWMAKVHLYLPFRSKHR